eukprot:CAMPEP_0194300310 /NCGR_PEP_ID=MMETSP0169-20130528/61185_1 /TAXON_ID=218684 /ORGANISM="Corethron pennatum, Strain L29A3" /LENGTH=527 /DNA_ID=CAMNT_0039050465 /DNA_START=251 /DNA_END=1831 /DNA_ORIENTATION=-
MKPDVRQDGNEIEVDIARQVNNDRNIDKIDSSSEESDKSCSSSNEDLTSEESMSNYFDKKNTNTSDEDLPSQENDAQVLNRIHIPGSNIKVNSSTKKKKKRRKKKSRKLDKNLRNAKKIDLPSLIEIEKQKEKINASVITRCKSTAIKEERETYCENILEKRSVEPVSDNYGSNLDILYEHVSARIPEVITNFSLEFVDFFTPSDVKIHRKIIDNEYKSDKEREIVNSWTISEEILWIMMGQKLSKAQSSVDHRKTQLNSFREAKHSDIINIQERRDETETVSKFAQSVCCVAQENEAREDSLSVNISNSQTDLSADVSDISLNDLHSNKSDETEDLVSITEAKKKTNVSDYDLIKQEVNVLLKLVDTVIASGGNKKFNRDTKSSRKHLEPVIEESKQFEETRNIDKTPAKMNEDNTLTAHQNMVSKQHTVDDSFNKTIKAILNDVSGIEKKKGVLFEKIAKYDEKGAIPRCSFSSEEKASSNLNSFQPFKSNDCYSCERCGHVQALKRNEPDSIYSVLGRRIMSGW